MIIEAVLLTITVFNFIIINFIFYETLRSRREHEFRLETIQALNDASDRFADYGYGDDFDLRIRRLKDEINEEPAKEYDSNVKNIPHEDVQHHVQKHLRDEVAD